MLIDWLSIKCPTGSLDPLVLSKYQAGQDRILKISGDGQLQWEVSAWESVRSDSHQIAFQVTGNHIRIQGSPARLIGDGCNVFSSGASAALDLVGCWHRMVSFVAQHTGLPLPHDYTLYSITRVDVTENLMLGSLNHVRQALSILRNCEGGRYRVSNKQGDSVYWGGASRLRKAKAYAKGAEIAFKTVKAFKAKIPQLTRHYTLEEISLASGLLRLELTLGAQFWRERVSEKWYAIKPDFLISEWKSYFDRMIGGAEMKNDDDVYERLLQVVYLSRSPKKGMYWVGQPMKSQAKAAYAIWNLIKTEGWEKAKSRTSKSTWYRNLGHLRAAGLSDADISQGNVVVLRKRILEAQPVTSWAELRSFCLAA